VSSATARGRADHARRALDRQPAHPAAQPRPQRLPEVLLAHEVVDGDDHRHARVQQRARHPRGVEDVVAAARLAALDDLAVALGCDTLEAGQEAARVSPDAARVVRRAGSRSRPASRRPGTPSH
jgi:hypothetical protein